MNILRQSTAVDILIGPFVDAGDGTTTEEGLSPSVILSKNGQTLAAKNDATTPTHDNAGYYNCELDATDTNTVGQLTVIVESSATHLAVRHDYQVIEEAVYDSFYVGSATNRVAGINGTIQTLDSLDTAQDTQHSSTQSDIAALNDPTAADIRAEIDSNSTQLAAIVADTNELQTDDIPGSLSSIDTKIDTIDGIVDAILVDTDSTIPGSISSIDTKIDTIDGIVDAILVDTDATIPGSLSSIDTKIDTIDGIVDAILVDTDATVPGLIAALNDISTADVNAQVSDVLKTDTIAELSGDPGATPTFEDALMLLYMALRNKRDTTGSSDEIHNNAGGVILTSSLSDDTVTFVKGKYA